MQNNERRRSLARIAATLDRLADHHLGYDDETELVDAKILVRSCFDRTPGVRMSLEDFSDKTRRADRENVDKRRKERQAAR
jgi:hypothetical protein